MDEFLSMHNISKTYDNGVKANEDISFSVRYGEMHAICGENGAGKSTLMKILYGLEQPSSGYIALKGKTVTIHNPNEAIRLGIGMVHQSFMLVPSMSVAENITLNHELLKGVFLDKKQAIEVTNQLSKQYGLHVEAEAFVENIPVGMKQRVEILKALYRGADLLILDEPTAVLTPQESEDLFASLRSFVKEGQKAVVFITHKLKEVMYASDSITVIQHGRITGHMETKNASEKEVVKRMVGRDVLMQYKKKEHVLGKKALKLNKLCYTDTAGIARLKNISFDISEGEILGIAGIEGNGQSELAEVIAGLKKASQGSVQFYDKMITQKTAKQIRELGIGHVPEDRIHNGIAASGTIDENILIDRFNKPAFNHFGLLKAKNIYNHVQNLIQKFDIRCKNQKIFMQSLSGGNMQKVIMAREISADPRLLIAAQPTRGVDIGAAEFIRHEIIALRDQGKAILLTSADLEEILGLSDRIAVMYKGEIVAMLNNSNLTESMLGQYMLGIKRQEQ